MDVPDLSICGTRCYETFQFVSLRADRLRRAALAGQTDGLYITH